MESNHLRHKLMNKKYNDIHKTSQGLAQNKTCENDSVCKLGGVINY